MGAHCYRPGATLKDAASPQKAAWGSLRTKTGRGKLARPSSKRDPRGASSWVPEDKGTPPAPWTPALNLLRPPLLVPTSRSSPAKLGRSGRVTLGEAGPPDRADPPRPRVAQPAVAPAPGKGDVLSVSSSLPLELLPKPGEWIWRTGDAWGCGLSKWAREQPTLQVFPVQGEVFPLPRGP